MQRCMREQWLPTPNTDSENTSFLWWYRVSNPQRNQILPRTVLPKGLPIQFLDILGILYCSTRKMQCEQWNKEKNKTYHPQSKLWWLIVSSYNRNIELYAGTHKMPDGPMEFMDFLCRSQWLLWCWYSVPNSVSRHKAILQRCMSFNKANSFLHP